MGRGAGGARDHRIALGGADLIEATGAGEVEQVLGFVVRGDRPGAGLKGRGDDEADRRDRAQEQQHGEEVERLTEEGPEAGPSRVLRESGGLREGRQGTERDDAQREECRPGHPCRTGHDGMVLGPGGGV